MADFYALEVEVEAFLELGDKFIAIDLSQLDFVYADCVKILIDISRSIKKLDGQLALITDKAKVSQILTRSGLNKKAKIVGTAEELPIIEEAQISALAEEPDDLPELQVIDNQTIVSQVTEPQVEDIIDTAAAETQNVLQEADAVLDEIDEIIEEATEENVRDSIEDDIAEDKDAILDEIIEQALIDEDDENIDKIDERNEINEDLDEKILEIEQELSNFAFEPIIIEDEPKSENNTIIEEQIGREVLAEENFGFESILGDTDVVLQDTAQVLVESLTPGYDSEMIDLEGILSEAYKEPSSEFGEKQDYSVGSETNVDMGIIDSNEDLNTVLIQEDVEPDSFSGLSKKENVLIGSNFVPENVQEDDVEYYKKIRKKGNYRKYKKKKDTGKTLIKILIFLVVVFIFLRIGFFLGIIRGHIDLYDVFLQRLIDLPIIGEHIPQSLLNNPNVTESFVVQSQENLATAIEIVTVPAGARIYMNNNFVGLSPIRISDTPQGRVVFRALLQGFRGHEWHLEDASIPQRLSVNLQQTQANTQNRQANAIQVASEATIFFNSQPPNAEIFLNGVSIGRANITTVRVMEGQHTFEFRRDNLRAAWTGRLRAGRNPAVLVRLQ